MKIIVTRYAARPGALLAAALLMMACAAPGAPNGAPAESRARAAVAMAAEAERNTYEGQGWNGSEWTYRCAGGRWLWVTYLNVGERESFAVLVHDGRQHLMKSAVTASGARYVDVNEERGLRWYTKGDEGFLNYLAADHTASEVQVLADCHAQAPGEPGLIPVNASGVGR
ncbi:hypothetical protein E6C76_10235 [Pseudothauera nasutitermitis]|uniref:C-type lysozyme inhibitor domain-containing protein n=1 Tax=Pseudothauera nasutitermitis TaxID=2565930 RepID=A0A4S4B0L8_9RHOO|nr:MliC family protein [Pseudothauera nasutitermitis]THF65906.1 hypothetical protein E6C76_10235 [Pseudothauera nasutitermitis]